MSATSSTLPRLQPRHSHPLVERGKPVGSAPYLRTLPSRQPTPRSTSLFAMPQEPEDARLTGGTRSLERRLLALNLAKPVKGVPVKRETLSA